jgi:hypothetical protein
MFRSDIIKYSSGYYKYDYSLSVSRMYNQFISWGQVLSRSFNPQVAATCYAYYPRRIQYSLPQQEELKRDNWQSFLVNNYKDMQDEITCVKPINKTGALIMLRSKSPIQIMGVDSLQTDSGVKVTIGDGGLFSQSLQSLVNSDEIYQYGSCQNRWSITSTPQGVFYVSQDQGKVFLYTGSLQEISKMGMKWWFSRYLPSNLKKLYPNYRVISDIGSGLNFKRKGLQELINLAIKNQIDEVVVAYKDRLARFGFELIEDLIKEYSNGRIIILNKNKDLEPEEELVKDVMSILNVYVAKMNGLRKYNKIKKTEDNIIKPLANNTNLL